MLSNDKIVSAKGELWRSCVLGNPKTCQKNHVDNINVAELSDSHITVVGTKDRKIESHASSYVALHPHQSNSESATGHVQTLSRPEMSQLTQT